LVTAFVFRGFLCLLLFPLVLLLLNFALLVLMEVSTLLRVLLIFPTLSYFLHVITAANCHLSLSVESSIGNQSGLSDDSSREQPLASSLAKPSQSPIEPQPSDRWQLAAKGIGFVGINSNSPEHYAEDSFAHMVQRMQEHNFPWVYLYDPTQDVARSYGALRTPHYFVFDGERKLVYCGRGLDQPKNPEKSTVNDLDNALDDLVSGRPVRMPLTNPIGCNVKWKGHDKHWMPEEACDLVW